MRYDLIEPFQEECILGSRRRRRSTGASTSAPERMALAPQAVDAALADEALYVRRDRATRRDESHLLLDEIEPPTRSAGSTDDELVQSLTAHLAMLNQQQREIRRLLSRAHAKGLDSIG
jgi:hypothetical protein